MADDYMEIDIGGLHSGIPGHQLELEGIRKDGTTFPLEAKISETRLDQRLFFTAAVRDITERKKVEQDLQRARDGAFEASRVKSEFLASMSHEIRTPMNAILGMSELLAESGLNADQREYLRVATTAGHHLLAVINDILDLSKIEAGQLRLEETDFDLYELVESTAEIMALRAHEKGLELTCDIGREVPQWVCGDPVRLRQLITNLLGNATKFTELGEVGLWVRCESGGESGSIVFSVSDTGIGIPPHKLDSIFGSFAQADSSTTRQYGGTGLGLSICKRLVQMMGGRIWVKSEVGRGSTFHFTGTFEVETASQGVDKAPCKDMAGLRALVLDDSATSRGILQEVLASMGASVVLASRADDALEQLEFAKAQGHPYQLLLLDTRMPEEDGFQVAQRIKAGPGLPVTTVMMLTSEDRASDIGRCEKMGISQHIVKPVKRIDLLRAIGTDIPQVPAALPWDEEQPPSPEDLPPVRILVVEDSEDNRLLVSSYLKPSPCQLDFAENGEVALSKFTAGHYDVVLMDVQMPVMDGYTATRAIREWERRHLMDPTPIIALTAHAMNEDVVKSMSAGCTDHITKPIKKGLLMQSIYQYSRNLAFSRGES